MVAKPQYITDERGRKKAVILPIRECEKLLEDLHDLQVLAERRAEQTISHERFWQSWRSEWCPVKPRRRRQEAQKHESNLSIETVPFAPCSDTQ